MKKINQQRLATLAIALLSGARGKRLIPPAKRKLEFNMSTYAVNPEYEEVFPRDVYKCGTSCCFIGYAPFVFKRAQKADSWDTVAWWVLGMKGNRYDNAWKFLFDPGWPNSPKHAAVRALYLLSHLEVNWGFYTMPQYGSPRLKPLLKLSKPAILSALAEFAGPPKPSSKPSAV